jgi:hypothetical protein
MLQCQPRCGKIWHNDGVVVVIAGCCDEQARRRRLRSIWKSCPCLVHRKAVEAQTKRACNPPKATNMDHCFSIRRMLLIQPPKATNMDHCFSTRRTLRFPKAVGLDLPPQWGFDAPRFHNAVPLSVLAAEVSPRPENSCKTGLHSHSWREK